MRPALAALALVLAPALAGCGGDRDVLIRVGDRVVTVEEFKEVARGNESQYLGTPDEARRAMFEDVLRRTLLLHEASQRGLDRDTLLIRMREAAEERLLVETLFQRMNPRRPGVSDAEVARARAWRDTASHLQVIYTPDRASAAAAAAEIRGGADFAAVADRYNLTGRMPPGGDFGWMAPGSLVPALDLHLRTAPVGEVVGPVEAAGEGWFVIRILERQYRPQSLAEPLVRDLIRQRKTRLAAIAAYRGLRDEYRLRLEPGAGSALFLELRSPAAGMGTAPPPGQPAEPERVLARWEAPGGTGAYRMREALDDLRAEQRMPDLDSQPALEAWIEQRAMRRVALLEARRRLIHEEPAIRRRIAAAVDNEVLQVIYEQDIASEARLLPLDVPAYYETVKDNYQRLESVTLDIATFEDSAAAAAVMTHHGGHGGHAAHGGAPPALAEAAAAAGVRAAIERRTVTFPSPDPAWQALQAAFIAQPAGQTLGPLREPAGWQVIRVVSKRQRAAEFGEIEPMIREMIERQADEQRRDAALQRVTEALKRRYHPEVHPERLESIPWPVEPAAPALAG